MPQTIDTLISARWIVPIEPAGVCLKQHSLAIDKGRIVAILPTAEAPASYLARERVDLGSHVLMPGLINLHSHAAMSLLRGLADDLPLMDWLNHHIWPAESRLVRDEFVYEGTLLALAEMLRGGVTCVNDMYFYPGATARALLTAKMRGMIGLTVLEFPTHYASDAADYLHKGLSTRDEFNGEPLLGFTLAPHAPYTISDQTFGKVVTLSEELELPIHVHLHESQQEIIDSLKDYHVRPLARLKALGLLSPNLIGVHCVHLTTDEIHWLAQHGCHVAHNPTSNMKLASGIAPVSALLEAGVNVGIGTDSAASNNRLDMLAEIRMTALLAKAATLQAQTVPAHQALAMATLHGAKALGLDHLIGSLLPGKAADLCAIRLDDLETAPCFDPISHLVYAAGREHVTDVWVAGRRLLQNRELTTLNAAQLVARARAWRDKVRS
ncbi:5-methylthioadenosine/S-adenosylhomocysteine deaminase [Chitinivorax tropicus]|uniref:5-methylthioadenosine/S-adenosylhomocysteine deaminase n=1 Tax=Chitinivorax tropicus TaxID=714531 RepID=A0A840MR91_9PROT|nr:TRZ/ATZ family hydrolase [Chitinivorax tropicus]MBB5019617.1 5-methylthioadenosine/S-adenosylhomocysteine deaminase [Chitinivorax tropicus]